MSLTDSPHYAVRTAVISAIVQVAPPKNAIPILLGMLDDKDLIVRERAAEALAGYGEAAAPACEKLARMAFTESFLSSYQFPMALREMKSKAAPALPILVEALQHSETQVRENGLDALGRMGPMAKPFVPLIVKLTKDPDEDVRWHAIDALGKVGGTSDEIIRVFAEALEDKGERHAVASSAADILWRMNRAPKVALPELIRSVMRQDPPGTTGYSPLSTIRSWAAKAIGKIGPAAKEALPVLRKERRGDWTGLDYAEAIKKIGK